MQHLILLVVVLTIVYPASCNLQFYRSSSSIQASFSTVSSSACNAFYNDTVSALINIDGMGGIGLCSACITYNLSGSGCPTKTSQFARIVGPAFGLLLNDSSIGSSCHISFIGVECPYHRLISYYFLNVDSFSTAFLVLHSNLEIVSIEYHTSNDTTWKMIHKDSQYAWVIGASNILNGVNIYLRLTSIFGTVIFDTVTVPQTASVVDSTCQFPSGLSTPTVATSGDHCPGSSYGMGYCRNDTWILNNPSFKNNSVEIVHSKWIATNFSFARLSIVNSTLSIIGNTVWNRTVVSMGAAKVQIQGNLTCDTCSIQYTFPPTSSQLIINGHSNFTDAKFILDLNYTIPPDQSPYIFMKTTEAPYFSSFPTFSIVNSPNCLISLINTTNTTLSLSFTKDCSPHNDPTAPIIGGTLAVFFFLLVSFLIVYQFLKEIIYKKKITELINNAP